MPNKENIAENELDDVTVADESALVAASQKLIEQNMESYKELAE